MKDAGSRAAWSFFFIFWIKYTYSFTGNAAKHAFDNRNKMKKNVIIGVNVYWIISLFIYNTERTELNKSTSVVNMIRRWNGSMPITTLLFIYHAVNIHRKCRKPGGLPHMFANRLAGVRVCVALTFNGLVMKSWAVSRTLTLCLQPLFGCLCPRHLAPRTCNDLWFKDWVLWLYVRNNSCTARLSFLIAKVWGAATAPATLEY